MKILDASFLIDYENGLESTKEYLVSHEDHEFVVPAPVYTEVLLGDVHRDGPTDLAAARASFSWAEVYPIDEAIATLAARVADEIGPEGPQLTGIDAIVAAVGRKLDAPIVSCDRDLTHPEVADVVAVESY